MDNNARKFTHISCFTENMEMEEAYTNKGTQRLLSEKYDPAYYSRNLTIVLFHVLKKNHKELHSPNKH